MNKVTFTEKDHKYSNSEGIQYISTTTVVSKYKQAFDSEYWSTYKAIEKILTENKSKAYFDQVKKKIGFEQIIPHFVNMINPEVIHKYKNQILSEWDKKNKDAQDAGTAYHKAKQEEVNASISDQIRIVGTTDNDSLTSLPGGVHTELTIWNHSNRLAGQADKVIVEDFYDPFTDTTTRFIDIEDYKTSNKIERESFKHFNKGYTMMKYPLDNLMDCNVSHYQMQLSVYGWMLEQYGYKIRNLTLYFSKHDEKVPVQYRPDLVNKMLLHVQEKESKRTTC